MSAWIEISKDTDFWNENIQVNPWFKNGWFLSGWFLENEVSWNELEKSEE